MLHGKGKSDSYEELLKTMIWREKAMLQAPHVLYIMIDEGLVSPDVKRGLWDEENLPLPHSGSQFYQRFAKKGRNILLTQTPPERCIGGHGSRHSCGCPIRLGIVEY
jgi:hypothetical protein